MAFRVMLVEDERHISQVLERRLQAEGVEVVIARDGIQALECARGSRPDVIVTDLEMPRMNGLELLRALSADASLREIPTLMLTARGHLADGEGVPEGTRVVAKPFSARKVTEMVLEILGGGERAAA